MSDTKTLQIEACGSLVFSGLAVRLSPDTEGLETMKAKHNACADAVRLLNDTQTNGDTKLLYAIRDYVVSEGITNTTMSKTVEVKANGKTSSFNVGNQAYHILSDVLNAVLEHIDRPDDNNISGKALKQGCVAMVEACWPESDDKEVSLTFNIGSTADDEPSLDDLDDDDDDEDTEASVSGSFISIDDIKAKASEPSVVENAFALYTNDDNVDANGGFFRFYNGKSKTSKALHHNSRSQLEQFKATVCNYMMANLSGLSWTRLNKQNETLFVPTPKENRDVGRRIVSAVMILSGVTKFNHDLRKYISDDTIGRICSAVYGEVPDGSNLKARAGWELPYERGNASPSVVDEAHTMNVINLL
jgi:hypothetical protein